MNNNAAAKKTGVGVRDIVLSGLLIALVFIFTAFVQFTLPFSVKGGLVHLGDVMLIISAIVFGKKKGAIAGAFGMGLSDLLTGWAIYAPFTFVIRGVMGYIVGTIANGKERKGKSVVWNIIAVIIGGIWMMAGYYIAEVIIYHNWLQPIASIPGNILQIVIGGIVGIPLSRVLKKRVTG